MTNEASGIQTTQRTDKERTNHNATLTSDATTTDATTTATKMTESQNQCMICFDTETQVNQGLVMCANDCKHWICRPCLKTYLIHCENNRKTTAVCPHPDCQVVVRTELIQEVLERAYTPKVWQKMSNQDNDDGEEKKGEDELVDDSDFAKWLTENENEVQQCEHCSVWIYRDDGCYAMQCLCGYRFCWECKMACSKCDCGWDVGDFYDNIRRIEGLGRKEELANADDLDNFASYYQRKEQGDDDDDDDSDKEEEED